MYGNQDDIDIAIRDFLSVPENYDIVKQVALNIITNAAANKKNLENNLESIISIVCTLHLLHGLSFEQIEEEVEYITAYEPE